ncbi:MAG: trypsin-like peptidase domain-containing protein [Anderseniella sp.]|jgi:serine protease Do|nr:trypsin-like peptidase domain-containing protein [Anderseniella sp.]
MSTSKTHSIARKSVLALAVAGLLGSAGLATTQGIFTPSPAIAQSALAGAPAEGFADLVDKVMPSVVSIQAKYTPASVMSDSGGSTQQFQFGFPPGSPFEQFFKSMPNGQGSPFNAPRRGGTSQGSGFIISEDGYAVTNNHVIKDSSEVTVKFSDGREYDAKVVGTDPKTDLALLKIEASETFTPLLFAETKPRVGDWVIAVGNPFGLGGTVTTGIISAAGRDIGAGPYDDFLQIDAPINRGNSGGPAFNLKGEVIGINTAIYSPSGGSVGIGFAIPASTAKAIISDLKDDGNVTRGWLGVQIQPVTGEIAESIGLDKASGTIIAAVTDDSPAGKAGLRTGDTILAVNGETVAGPKELSRKVAGIKPGTSVDMTVYRGGKERTVKVAIGTMPGEAVAALPGSQPEDTPRFGLALAPSPSGEGVAVADVLAGSPAAEQGIERGDVILEVDGSSVDQPEAAAQAMRQALNKGGKAILLLVKNERGQRFVALQNPKG